MPLEHGNSRAVFSRNVSEMRNAGHPMANSLAAAYRMARAHRAMGGQLGAGMPGTGMAMPQMAGLGGLPALQQQPQPPAPTMSTAPTPQTPGLGAVGAPPMRPQGQPPIGPGFAAGGMPSMSPPWFAKSAAHQMMHTGPINSPVAGRTDHLALNVPAGSYVLPADHVSSLGQGNTAAGQAVVSRMFSTGPFGGPQAKMAHGTGSPRAPAAPKFARGGGVVPIMAAGGEHVLSPEQVAMVGHGDISLGHKILDEWVKSTRRKHIKTLTKLPGPAK